MEPVPHVVEAQSQPLDHQVSPTGQVLWQVCTIWFISQHFYCINHPPSPCLVIYTNSPINTQLTKFVETLQTPWPNTPLLILLNLRSMPSRTNKLRVTRHPMPLAVASFDPQLIKGEILQYYKGLLLTKNNHALVEQSFHRHSLETKTLMRGHLMRWHLMREFSQDIQIRLVGILLPNLGWWHNTSNNLQYLYLDNIWTLG